jgi:hypothetical protein
MVTTIQKKKTPTKGNTKPEKKTLQAQPSEEKEQLYTIRLFITNSLNEGAM